MDIESMREDYKQGELRKKSVEASPFAQLEKWISEAVKAEMPEPNAMTLATIGLDGAPNARVVLLKGLSEKGLDFYTNYESEKGRELAVNPHVSLVFLWLGLERQVRVRGRVKKLDEEASDAYFRSRPRMSQLGAIVSSQSSVVREREDMDKAFKALLEQMEGKEELDRPKYWGGYRVEANYFEFWQGRRSRLHDRICYELKDGAWSLKRLAP